MMSDETVQVSDFPPEGFMNVSIKLHGFTPISCQEIFTFFYSKPQKLSPCRSQLITSVGRVHGNPSNPLRSGSTDRPLVLTCN